MSQREVSETISMPAPSAWPMAAALGLTLALAGIVTNSWVTLAGVSLACVAFWAWALEVMPRGREIEVERVPEEAAAEIPASRPGTLAVGEADHRARLPLEIHPYRSGFYGGLAGGGAMATVALTYGVAFGGSVWYPINLLAGMVLPMGSHDTAQGLTAFHADALAIGFGIHATASIFVGLVFAAVLPMLPRSPLLWGGILAPLIWTGLLWGSMGILNPLLRAHVDWSWFLASQIAFGVVAGGVIARSTRIATRQHLAFVERAGLERSRAPRDPAP